MSNLLEEPRLAAPFSDWKKSIPDKFFSKGTTSRPCRNRADASSVVTVK